MQLIYDLVLNDDSIIDDGFYVRDTLGNNMKLIDRFIDTIRNARFDVTTEG